MGGPMADHLMTKGKYNLKVFNRTQSKTDDLVKKGAKFT